MTGQYDWTYAPPGPISSAFMHSQAFVRGLMGPIGSGKSTACVMEIIARSMEQEPGPDGIRRTRWAIIRNSYPELKTTTIKTWHQWVPERLGDWRAEGPPRHLVRNADTEIEVLFIALDKPSDISKLLSLELTGAWVNEAREVPKAIIDALTGRVGRFPPKRDGGPTWSGILLDTNPPDTDHWWYRLAEEDRPQGFEFFRQPSGLSDQAENTENLPRAYYDRAVAGKDDNWIKVYVHGEYGFVQDGKPVYPEYQDHLHCVEVEADQRFPLTIGMDFGLTPAAVIGQRLPLGRWIWIDELVTEDMGAVRFAEMLKAKLASDWDGYQIEKVWGDPAGDQRAQTDERTPFQIMQAAGIPANPAPTNDVALRREAVAQPLSRLIDGKPGLLIHPRCRQLRKAMAGGYRYRRLQVTGSERYQDVPEKNAFSHVADAAQYLMIGGGEGARLTKRVLPFKAPGEAVTTRNRNHNQGAAVTSRRR